MVDKIVGEAMIYLISINTICLIIGIVLFLIAWGNRPKPPKMCDSCKHLLMKSGGRHQYNCGRDCGQLYGGVHNYDYDSAPEYCSFYVQMNGIESPNVNNCGE